MDYMYVIFRSPVNLFKKVFSILYVLPVSDSVSIPLFGYSTVASLVLPAVTSIALNPFLPNSDGFLAANAQILMLYCERILKV